MARIKTSRKARRAFHHRARHRINKNKFMAYDLETDLIDAGTPNVRYFTAYDGENVISECVTSLDELGEVLQNILTIKNKGVVFVAHNANNFDVKFVMPALDKLGYLIEIIGKPTGIRAFIVSHPDDPKLKWKFQDSIAMTGIQRSLKDFVKSFAPEHSKTDIGLANGVEFDSNNREHVEYAENDSIVLYHAINKADKLMMEKFGLSLGMTVGGAAIKTMEMHLPKQTEQGNDLNIWDTPPDCTEAIRNAGYRGGYCVNMGIYEGPISKYDINQAYGAAMRETKLPAGMCVNTYQYMFNKCGMYIVDAYRDKPSIVPFYYVEFETGEQRFSTFEIRDGRLTHTEIEQLISEGWELKINEGWYWSDTFTLDGYVTHLENIRFSDPEGPSGPLGTMAKALGNNAYGKTTEILDGLDIVYSTRPLEGYILYQEETPGFDNVWCKPSDKDTYRPYHKPQLGMFITAYVRMVVRRAALLAGDDFQYADTDCIASRKPIKDLDIDSRRYGAWKIEYIDTWSIFIDRKVYCIFTDNGPLMKFKGLRNNSLSVDDYNDAKNRLPVTKTQIQGNSVLKVMNGEAMFRSITKIGNRKMVKKE